MPPKETTTRRMAAIEEVQLNIEFWRLGALVLDGAAGCMLDSSTENPGQWSFLGLDPSTMVTGSRTEGGEAEIEIVDLRSGTKDQQTADPFEFLKRFLAERPKTESKEPIPFIGGAMGYLAYECGHFVEEFPCTMRQDHPVPDFALLVFDELLAHCHETGKTFAIALPADGRSPAAERANEVKARAEQYRPTPQKAERRSSAFQGGFEPEEYRKQVRQIQDEIDAGEVYEVCLTHRMKTTFSVETQAWPMYKALRTQNPAPHGGILHFPFLTVLSASPERFLKVGQDGWAESRPIKGTRPRGATPAEDETLRQELLSSEKDKAENLMIVDLVRNDLGRVSEFGSVHTSRLMEIETHPSVFQMVSTIRGKLAPGRDGIDALKACFPGGSMTGAPKIASMKSIDRLEPVARGVYSGCLGYFDDRGTFDLSIVIRSLVCVDGMGLLHAGGAVVADSIGQLEYEEACHKMRALIEALQASAEHGAPTQT